MTNTDGIIILLFMIATRVVGPYLYPDIFNRDGNWFAVGVVIGLFAAGTVHTIRRHVAPDRHPHATDHCPVLLC